MSVLSFGVYVCPSVTTVNCGKTADLIELLFTMVGLRNHVLDRGPDLPGQGQTFFLGGGNGVVQCNV